MHYVMVLLCCLVRMQTPCTEYSLYFPPFSFCCTTVATPIKVFDIPLIAPAIVYHCTTVAFQEKVWENQVTFTC